MHNAMRYFLGVDLGGTKSHVAIADETGLVVGFGHAGPGNHQGVGYGGMLLAMQEALAQALTTCGLTKEAIHGAGFGVAGYDWPSTKPVMASVIDQLGLACPYEIVNDAVPALIAGAEDGWGVALVSGTGCNCRGRDREHRREGRVTGYGYRLGEFAGATELVWRAMQLVANHWTQRGPATAISAAFVGITGAKDLEDLIEGYTEHRYEIDPQAALLILEAARQGDQVAIELIRWAGLELGEMARAVIRQLKIESLAFDVVLSGSMFNGGAILIEPMWQNIVQLAPRARLVYLTQPPVLGTVILGMEQARLQVTPAVRHNLAKSWPAAANAPQQLTP